MINEWGRENEPVYTCMIVGFVFLVGLLLVVTAFLSGCATHQWPEIGNGVAVEKITIRECKRGEC